MDRQILFCRRPGLLSQAARRGRRSAEAASPLVVADGTRVRDACPLAVSRGITIGAGVIQARRLCPVVLVVPLEAIDHRPATREFLDRLAELSPTVEPDGPDAAYADVTGLSDGSLRSQLSADPSHRPAGGSPSPTRGGCGSQLSARWSAERLAAWLTSPPSTEHRAPSAVLPPVIGLGCSRVAARACAECGLPAHRLADADARWLWPEDEEITARLRRLGLETFGQVAALSEGALVYQFGRRGRLLYRRAHGQDLMPIRACYPPPRADARRDFSLHPVDNRQRLEAALAEVSAETTRQMRRLGRAGRRITLHLTTEEGELRREGVLLTPVQDEDGVTRAAGRLLAQMAIPAPVTSLHLLIEGLEPPAAQTLELFREWHAARSTQHAAGEGAGRPASSSLRAACCVLRALSIRYGPQTVIALGQRPVTTRDVRRTLLQDRWGAER